MIFYDDIEFFTNPILTTVSTLVLLIYYAVETVASLYISFTGEAFATTGSNSFIYVK